MRRRGQPVLALLAMAVVTLVVAGVGAAQDANQAAVVVRLGDERVESRCVTFDEPQISGYELLTRAGFEIEERLEGQGVLVCSIASVGCPSDDCFCQCAGGPDCVYWSYWHRQGGAWQYARSSAASYQVSQGMVEGWSWGPGTVSEAIEPPELTFGEVCSGSPNPTTTSNSTETGGQRGNNLVGFAALALVLVLAFLLLRTQRRTG